MLSQVVHTGTILHEMLSQVLHTGTILHEMRSQVVHTGTILHEMIKDYDNSFNSAKFPLWHSLVHVIGEFVVASQSYKCSKSKTIGEEYLGYSINPHL
jgi:hypothetical protein